MPRARWTRRRFPARRRRPRAIRRLLVGALVATTAVLGSAGSARSSTPTSEPTSNLASDLASDLANDLAPAPAPGVAYQPPVAGPLVVLRGFDHVGIYEAGHRGVDLRTPPGGPVLAAADGVVSFAGQVAGRGVVTITHPDGIRTSYEPLTPSVTAGTAVRAGEVIGAVSGAHGEFPANVVVHWGARRGEVYLDPLGLLGGLGPVRLLPWDTG